MWLRDLGFSLKYIPSFFCALDSPAPYIYITNLNISWSTTYCTLKTEDYSEYLLTKHLLAVFCSLESKFVPFWLNLMFVYFTAVYSIFKENWRSWSSSQVLFRCAQILELHISCLCCLCNGGLMSWQGSQGFSWSVFVPPFSVFHGMFDDSLLVYIPKIVTTENSLRK